MINATSCTSNPVIKCIVCNLRVLGNASILTINLDYAA